MIVEEGYDSHVDERKEAKVIVEEGNDSHADDEKEAKVIVEDGNDGHVDVILNVDDELCEQIPLVQKGPNVETDDQFSRMKRIQDSFECWRSR